MKKKTLNRIPEVLGYLTFACLMAFLVAWFLRPPVPPGQQTIVARSDADAAALRSYLALPGATPVIVEFMDFECPPCRATWPKVKQLLRQFPKVLYRPINFPLPMHPFAFGAAVTSEVARSKGKFDSAFDDLFTGATDLDVKSLNRYLSKHHLDPCVGTARSKPYQELVRKGQALANSLKVNATPTLFLLLPDGSLNEVRPLDEIAKMLSGL